MDSQGPRVNENDSSQPTLMDSQPPVGFPMAGYTISDDMDNEIESVDGEQIVRRTFAGYGSDQVVEVGSVATTGSGNPDGADEKQRDPGDGSVKVIVRVRPPLSRELEGYHTYAPAFSIEKGDTTDSVTLSENLNSVGSGGVENGVVYNTYRFGFDKVYSPESRQEDVYCESARDAVMNVLQGYNASIIAYGQTGAGKTHTMTGTLTGEGRGIIPRSVDDIFEHISQDFHREEATLDAPVNYLVRASYLQIYNEVISDLLKPDSKNLTIREDAKRGVFVEGLSEWVVRTPADVYDLMSRGAEARMTGSTRLNHLSSRSHAIFILVVEKGYMSKGADSCGQMQRSVCMGKLNLVDLAGSERVHLTGARGTRLEESKKINQSLSALGNVIGALTDPKRTQVKPHIPYRDSKLTRILEDSLGGNCKTTFVAVISPAVEAFSESLSTLKFANRAKRVKNAPRVNEDENQRTLLKKYEKELKRLRAELQARGKDLVDKRLVLQLEEARRKEQADKIAAISALERQSAEIARQKAAMASLQKRISSMQSQLLVGGQSVQDTPAFRNLLAREQSKIRDEYERRLAELENERRLIAEDKAATERLKSLLLKQRDVMVALTKRLGERDKEVLDLQSSLESSEKRLKETEDALDRRTAQLISIRKRLASVTFSKENSASECNVGDEPDECSLSVMLQEVEHDDESANGPLEVTSELSSKVSLDGNEEECADKNAPVIIQEKEQVESAGEAVQVEEEDEQGTRHPHTAAIPDQAVAMNKWAEERDALKTILELKVLSLLDTVEGSVQNFQDKSQDQQKVLLQLGHLKKLVAATVTAMEVV